MNEYDKSLKTSKDKSNHSPAFTLKEKTPVYFLLTNKLEVFKNCMLFSGLSDRCKFVITVLSLYLKKLTPK